MANYDFLNNFLAVVLGIVITFGGESLISHKEERNNLKNCLTLVSSELNDNKESLKYCDTLVQNELEAALFLIRYEDNFTAAPKDSLYAVANTPLILEEINVYDDAFELLKSSGVLTKIKDKKLALEIFKTYDAFETIVTFLNSFYDHKTKYLETAMNDKVTEVLAKDNVTAVELWTAITATKEGKQFLREIIRFLTYYDPEVVYSMSDSTVARIDSYVR